jgi:hypothetical protein
MASIIFLAFEMAATISEINLKFRKLIFKNKND